MESIIRMLLNGELYPADGIQVSDPEYKKLCKQIGDELDFLENNSTDIDQSHFLDLEDLISERSSLMLEAGFSYGFKLGARLVLEIINE